MGSFSKCILFILITLMPCSPAMCADVDPGLPLGNESLPNDLLVIISPSHFQASVGDILNISYVVINKCNYTLGSVSLDTQENGSVPLNMSILLPGCALGGIESLKLNNSDFAGPIIRTVQVTAKKPSGKRIIQENSTSIELRMRE